MDISQFIVGLVLLVIFFGAMRFIAKIVAWGLILFVGIPFLFSGPVAGVDWSEIYDDLRDRAVEFLDDDLSGLGNRPGGDVTLTLRTGDARCGSSEPLRFGVWNEADGDLAAYEYRLSWRPDARSDWRVFRKGTSRSMIPAGRSAGVCIAAPAAAGPRAAYRSDLIASTFGRLGREVQPRS